MYTDYRGSVRQINVDRQQRDCQTNKCRQTIEGALDKEMQTDNRGSVRQINVDRQQRECQTNKCRQTIEGVLDK